MPTTSVVAPSVSLAAALTHIEPVPLRSLDAAFDDPAWLFEPRYDGLRGFLYGSDQGCGFKRLPDMGRRVQDLGHRIAEVLGGREVILDGEVVALDRRGKPTLQHLVQGEGHLAFAAYDLLWLDGVDQRDYPLRERRERLAQLLPEDTGPLYKILTIEQHGRALFGAIQRLDLPGIVAKQLEDPYHPSTRWYVVQNPGRSRSATLWEGVERRRTRRRRSQPDL